MDKSKRNFKIDLAKYYHIGYPNGHLSPGQKARLWIFNHGLHCVAIYRLGRFAERLCKSSKIPGLPFLIVHRLLNYIVRAVYHVDIDDAQIGPGLYIGHIGNIYIGPTEIGSDFSVTHNVTIGIGYLGEQRGVPQIGNNVWIGTGSVISRPISIGNKVTISSGSILTRNLPDGCLVAGNPARIVLQDYDNSKLLGWDYYKFMRMAAGKPQKATEPDISSSEAK